VHCVFSDSRDPDPGSRRSPDVAKSDPQGSPSGGGVQERRLEDGKQDETVSAAVSWTEQDRDILNSMPSVRQLRQKFTSTDQTTVDTDDESVVTPRRVSRRTTYSVHRKITDPRGSDPAMPQWSMASLP